MSRKRKTEKNIRKIMSTVICTLAIIVLFIINNNTYNVNSSNESSNVNYNTIQEVPEYSGEKYVQINNNKPYFDENDYTTKVYENYSELDDKGRCGVASANICKETMPAQGEKRGEISSVKPTGWKQNKYNGEFLYNRCHLIGYQLADENANNRNLITGTRYFNVEGMLPFENKVAEYVKNSKENVHVLYRVTPDFRGDNLLANGVEMEAYSVEDSGKSVSFNVSVYNVQPGININYKTGENWK